MLDRGHIIHDASGHPVRMIGGMTDLTQRKQAEEYISQQAALIDEARDAICVCSLEHRILFWNKGAERLFGYTATEAQGQMLPELLPLEQDKFREANRIVRETGGWNGEIEKQARDGTVLKLDGRWTLLKNAEGRPDRILILDTDITDRRRLEEQFLRSQRMESIGTLAGCAAPAKPLFAPDENGRLQPVASIDYKDKFTLSRFAWASRFQSLSETFPLVPPDNFILPA